MNRNTIYWILNGLAGIFMIVDESFFALKFKGSYPDNIYFGSFLLCVSIIVLLVKTILWYKKKNESKKV